MSQFAVRARRNSAYFLCIIRRNSPTQVERIRIFVGDSACMCRAAVRFDNLAAATAAVDALDGRYFAERSLVAEFDDGALSSQLPRGSDTARQQRYGFGEMAAATQDSIRVLQLASAEGAPFIACETFVVKVDHYTYKPAAHAPGGVAGYYRDDDAPPPDPHEQSRAILLQAGLGAISARSRRGLGAISARSRRAGEQLPPMRPDARDRAGVAT